jgi:DNA-binding MurR/RpiR family transcriptional regulator
LLSGSPGSNSRLHQSVSGKNLFEKLLQVEKTDLIVAYHFYKPTIDFRRLMEVSTEREVPVVLVTDSLVPPMIRHAKVILFAPRGSAGTFHSQVVPLSINNPLINGVASKLGDRAVQALQERSEMRRKHYFSDFSTFSQPDSDQ